MPVLVALTGMSLRTASICLPTVRGGMGSISYTPWVFWAVMAVMAQVPKTPSAANVLRSASIPAPPPLSEPAIVSAHGTFFVVNPMSLLEGCQQTLLFRSCSLLLITVSFPQNFRIFPARFTGILALWLLLSKLRRTSGSICSRGR